MVGYFVRLLRGWRRQWRYHQPIITVEVSAAALRANLHAIQTFVPQWQVAPVLKSNAYGHGLALVAHVLEDEQSVPFFAIDSYFEAEMLHADGISKPLLILGHTRTKTIVQNRLRNVAFVIASIEQLRTLVEENVRQHIHLKFDTGMHRQGILPEQIDEVVELLQKNTALTVDGVLSHFADAEVADSKITAMQIERWNAVAKKMQKEFPSIQYYHLSNSAGFAHAKDVIANVGRLGKALYGINPGNLSVPLVPALRMTSVVSEIRTIEKGEVVGYNGTFVADKKTTLATVPGGYFEGIDRRLSNKGFFKIRGSLAPIAGRVSMNISSCDVTGIDGVAIGDDVELISNIAGESNSTAEIARLCGTIAYDVLVRIPAHLHRKVVQ